MLLTVRSISPADRLSAAPPMLASKTPLDEAFIGDSVITVGNVAAGAATAVAGATAATATEGATTANAVGASVDAADVAADAIMGSVLTYCKLVHT